MGTGNETEGCFVPPPPPCISAHLQLQLLGAGRRSEIKGSRASDDYQQGSLGSCFLSADVAPVIQLAELLSDSWATSFMVGQIGSAAAQQRHPVEKKNSEAGKGKDADPVTAPEADSEDQGAVPQHAT
ncbi:hypothetical protein ILYODFUR_027311 [Ilyodon furcidens]|uniref:Uncharacterized protein n=1 Tax=Ilyodon furcidens TaxID=33524 RepID=A0ABV0SSS0_9TELE